ncbi:MAG: hypothetical protein A2X12_05915 [Bacteroidetes bacterium GWE2_29_8]|nr:MAG: hypothetical protein A2X12_05915 [Bacteroidetes bacterium GWE2_29_8]OFY18752.1 MAG: hypothetical protein A2X02_04380 [Bacteroidetes bacterium GWF2_29_10]
MKAIINNKIVEMIIGFIISILEFSLYLYIINFDFLYLYKINASNDLKRLAFIVIFMTVFASYYFKQKKISYFLTKEFFISLFKRIFYAVIITVLLINLIGYINLL